MPGALEPAAPCTVAPAAFPIGGLQDIGGLAYIDRNPLTKLTF
jgi:hypothetical protein